MKGCESNVFERNVPFSCKGGVCVFHTRETPTCMSGAWLLTFLKSPWDVTQGHFGFNNQVSDGGDTMNSFKSFVKTVADKAQAEFPSPVKASTGATAASANESAEGKTFWFMSRL